MLSVTFATITEGLDILKTYSKVDDSSIVGYPGGLWVPMALVEQYEPEQIEELGLLGWIFDPTRGGCLFRFNLDSADDIPVVVVPPLEETP